MIVHTTSTLLKMTNNRLASSPDWSAITRLDELKALGPFKSVKERLQRDLGMRVPARGWTDLLDFIQRCQLRFGSKDYHAESSSQDGAETYFRSPSHRYIFALVELDGRSRLDVLGIDRRHFHDRTLAKVWFREVSKLVHPDKVQHARSHDAMAQLKIMYNEMTHRK